MIAILSLLFQNKILLYFFKLPLLFYDKIPENFKNKSKKEQEKLKCSYCNLNQEMTQMHCLDLRTDLDLKNINDLVKFFQRLLAERTKKDEEVTGLKTGRPHCTTPAAGGDSSES